MIELYRQYKPTIHFLLKFVIVYITLINVYDYYLKSFDSELIQDTDAATYEVAAQSSNLAELLGFESHIFQHSEESSVVFYLDGQYKVKIVEGCNGIAVMILFLSFVVAFGGRIIDMLLYVPMGIFVIHLSNVVRLTFLTYLFVYHNEYSKEFHDFIFPAIIYGMTFVLWVIWVNYFAFKYSTKKKSVICS